jgi:hypothetical protein
VYTTASQHGVPLPAICLVLTDIYRYRVKTEIYM